MTQNVEDLIGRVTSAGGGLFLRRAHPRVHQALSDLYSPLFYAIENLLDNSDPVSRETLLLGNLDHLAADGGRWLSLFSKAISSNTRYKFRVCTPSIDKRSLKWKEILHQLPHPTHRLVVEDAIKLYGPAADVVIYSSYGDINQDLALISSGALGLIKNGASILWVSNTTAEAIAARAVLAANGYIVEAELPLFDGSGERIEACFGSHWMRLSAGGQVASRDSLDKICHKATLIGLLVEAEMRRVQGRQAKQAAARSIGTIVPQGVPIDGVRSGPALYVSPGLGVDLSSGRLFAQGEDGVTRYTDEQLTKAALAAAPHGADPASMEYRFHLLAWAIENAIVKFASEVKDVSSPVQNIDDQKGRVIEEAPRGLNAVAIYQPGPKRYGRGPVPVLAATAHVSSEGASESSADVFESIAAAAISWSRSKGFRADSDEISYVEENPSGELSIESDGGSIWALRLDDRSTLANGAFWRVELAIVASSPVALGLRLSQVRQSESAPPPVSGVPKVLAELARNFQLLEGGLRVSPYSQLVVSEKDEELLLSLLSSESRRLPIVVASTGDMASADPSFDSLARRLCGVARVFVVSHGLSERLNREFGESRSVYGRAVRVYMPGFDATADPKLHPLWIMRGQGLTLAQANQVADVVCGHSVSDDEFDERVPTFAEVKKVVGEARVRNFERAARVAARSVDEERERQLAVRSGLESQIAALNEQVERLRQQLLEAKEDLRLARIDLDNAKANADERNAPPYGEQANQVSESDRESSGIIYPDSWDDLETWVEMYARDRLVILPSAAKAARKSPFKDVEFCYRVLNFLAQFYVPMRLRDESDEGVWIEYERARDELGVEVTDVGTAKSDRRYKGEYRKMYLGRNITLNEHVKRGAGFDSGKIFRLYFWFDRENEQVVIGHFPTHLTNRKSHNG